MANNPLLYNAALAGAAGGVHQRWLSNSSSASYSAVASAIVALATAVDAAIPSSTTITQANVDLLEAICGGVLTTRYLQSAAAADYTALASSIKALYDQLAAQLATQSTPLGFSVDVLPSVEASGTVASAATTQVLLAPLADATWYSTTVEVLLTNTIVPTRYIYRNQLEFFRSGGTAQLFYTPAVIPVEQPAGGAGVYSVAVVPSGNNIAVSVTNASLASVSFGAYMGFSRKRIP